MSSTTIQTVATTIDARQDRKVSLTARQSVLISNLFTSFLAGRPAVNPHYDEVKEQSAGWLISIAKLDERASKRIGKLNIAYFAAHVAPTAEASRFKTMCDWLNWIFPFDDLFDNGDFRSNVEYAKAVTVNLMDCVISSNTSRQPMLPSIAAHDDIWYRLRSGASHGTQQRYAAYMQAYLEGVVDQVYAGETHAQSQTPEEYLDYRRRSVGVRPMFPLIEYCYNLDLPEDVFSHKVICELEDMAVDLVLIHNDILSYQKEEAEGVPHNLIQIFRDRRLSAQAAFDAAIAMAEDRIARWPVVAASTLHWHDEKIDRQVQQYMQCLKNTITGNLHWSFTTRRYQMDGHTGKEAFWIEVTPSVRLD